MSTGVNEIFPRRCAFSMFKSMTTTVKPALFYVSEGTAKPHPAKTPSTGRWLSLLARDGIGVAIEMGVSGEFGAVRPGAACLRRARRLLCGRFPETRGRGADWPRENPS